jgi:hypothetical protein
MKLIKEYEQFIEESYLTPLFEGVEWNGVEIASARVYGGKNKQTGKANDLTGRIVFIYNDTPYYYKVKAKVTKALITWYNGPIAVESVWKDKNDGKVYVKDNTDKVFLMDTTILNTLTKKVKAKSSSIIISGTGKVKGIEGDYNATLTKVTA